MANEGLIFSQRKADTSLYGKANILSSFDLSPNRPEVAAQLIAKHSTDFRHTMGMDLMLMGLEMPIAAEQYTAFSEGRFWSTATVQAQSSEPGQNEALDIRIKTTSDGQTSPNYAFLPKVGHVIQFPGEAMVQGLVTAVDTAQIATYVTITVVPANGGTLPQVDAEDELMILTAAWGEGTGQPEPTTRTFGKENYFLQIIKDKFGITGSQMTNQLEFDVTEDGKKIGIYNYGVTDLEARQLRMIESALLNSSGLLYDHANLLTAKLAKASYNNFAQTTKGIIPWIKDRGKVEELAASAWDLTTFDDIDDYLKSEGDTSSIVMGYLGKNVARRLNGQLAGVTSVQNAHDPTSALSQYLGGAGYDDVTVGAKAVFLRFMEYANINRVWAFRELQSFADTKGFGASGFPYPDSSMWFPLTNVTEGKTNTVVPLVGLMYKMKDGYSRKMEMWNLKAADGDTGNYNIEDDEKIVNARSHIGLVFHKPNLGIWTAPSDD